MPRLKRAFRLIPIALAIGVIFCQATVSAQTTWSPPPPNSPALILGYMRFHVALATAIGKATGAASRELSAAAQETLGLSLAEFNIVTQECQTALANYAAAARTAGGAAVVRQQREQLLASDFTHLLATISSSGAAKLSAYINGPFRASVRSKPVQGGQQ